MENKSMKMEKVNCITKLFVMLTIALVVCSCGNNVVKIQGDTITLLDVDMTVTMEKFSFIQQNEEDNQYDEWEVVITSNPKLESAMLFDTNSGGFYLTPIANVNGNNIMIEGVNGTGSNFSFKIPKGETPISYQIKIKDRILTYQYDKKAWTYSENDNDFKPAEKIRM